MHTFILKNTVKEKEHFRNFVKIKYDIIMRRLKFSDRYEISLVEITLELDQLE